MPIRSQHGRAAAYRPFWQWPLRSPKRLALSVLTVIALAAAGSYAIGGFAGPGSGRSTGVAESPSESAPAPPTATALPPVPALEPETLPLSKAPPAALDVARRWARAWVRPAAGTGPGQWLD